MTAAPGTLSSDQAQFIGCLVGSVPGLDEAVATAWVGAESPWGATYGNHNYLNMKGGSGWATYPDACSAGKAAADNLKADKTNANGYQNILAAAAAHDPLKTIAAIIASKWDEGHYGGPGGSLAKIYAQLDPSKNFDASGLSGLVQDYQQGGGIGAGIKTELDAIVKIGQVVGQAAYWLSVKRNILRVAQAIVGVVAVFFGLSLLARGGFTPVGTAIRVAKGATPSNIATTGA